MFQAIKKDIIIKMYIYIVIIIIIILTITLFANEILIMLLNPIKEINNDWHNKAIQNVINESFNLADTFELLKSDLNIICNEIDYIPVCELNIKTHTLYLIIVKIVLHMTVLCCIVIMQYEIWISIIPHLYFIEKKELLLNQLNLMLKVCTAILITYIIWVRLYLNISMHNYNEYNYYEFDVDIDINQYINRYIVATYFHILIITYGSKTQYIYIMALIMLLFSEWLVLEVIYYAVLITIVNELRKIYKYIKNMLYN